MARKRYQLTAAAKASTAVQGGQYQGRVPHQEDLGGGSIKKKYRRSEKVAITLADPQNDVVATSDPTSQNAMEKQFLHAMFGGDGEISVWEDVTGSTTDGDVTVDLDT